MIDMDFSDYSTAVLMDILKEYNVRQSGRTTRLIDHYIQCLFQHSNEWITIEDHKDLDIEKEERIKLANQLSQKIIKRLESEHNLNVSPTYIKILKNVSDDGLPMLKLTMHNHNTDMYDSIKSEILKRSSSDNKCM